MIIITMQIFTLCALGIILTVLLTLGFSRLFQGERNPDRPLHKIYLRELHAYCAHDSKRREPPHFPGIESGNMREELADRFGAIPPEVENLLKTVEIRQLCKAANIEKIDAGAKGFLLAFHNNVFRAPEKLVDMVARSFGAMKVRPDQKILVSRDLAAYNVRLEAIRDCVARINRL